MTYELTAVRGPCLGRCMYGRCAVYGGCGPRHRRCGPILLRGGPGSDARGGRVFRARATAPGGAVRLVLACFARAPAPPARDPTRAGPRGRPSCVLYSDYNRNRKPRDRGT